MSFVHPLSSLIAALTRACRRAWRCHGKACLLSGALLLSSAPIPAVAGVDLDAVLARGQLVCGVGSGLAGFSVADGQGRWSGMDVDFCRAVAAALFGDASKLRLVPLAPAQRLTALQTGQVDLLARHAATALSREAASGVQFVGISYYDGQGFMVVRKLGARSARDLGGATICLQPGSASEANFIDFAQAANLQYKPVPFDKPEDLEQGFFAGQCDVYTLDTSLLAAGRARRGASPEQYPILPEIISKEPLGPVVRRGDSQLVDLVRWTLFALIEAEEKDVTSRNVEEMLRSGDPVVKRLLGATPGMGKALGLEDDWVVKVIKAVGNYGELFERNVGKTTPLKVERGLNALWTHGGLHYAPPFR